MRGNRSCETANMNNYIPCENTPRLRIGFIILTWNSEKYIDRCLKSILKIIEFDIFISIYDNGSTDSTLFILDKYMNNMNIFVTKTEKNVGTTISRNTAYAKLPEVDLICILDSDTEITEPNKFAAMSCLVNEDLNIGAIGPRLYGEHGNLQMSGRLLPSFLTKISKVVPIKKISVNAECRELVDFEAVNGELVCVGYLMSACIVLRNEVFKIINGFDEKIFYAPEDVDFCSKIWKLGLKVFYYKECSVLHYWQRLSRKKLFSKHNYEHIKGLLYYSRKFNAKFRKRINNIAVEYNLNN